jgi:hypothetical protein
MITGVPKVFLFFWELFFLLGVPTVPDMEAARLRGWDPKRQILR